ncbi:type II secretion system protein GspN [candidate division CSSED10-310 bacterium]|uniref:Type II secretion system protein GspN n=1 Tax=candidate division CSSED10-310 bacterium TaxID=2855610 RepID=A0ABV6Z6R2_UNCC1
MALKSRTALNSLPEILVYLGFFVFFFFLFVFMNLPQEKIQQRVSDELNYMTRGRASVDTMKLRPILAFKAKVFTYNLRNKQGEDLPLIFRNIKGKLSWLHFLFGQYHLACSGEFATGMIDLQGDLQKESNIWKVKLNGQEVSFSVLQDYFQDVNVQGNLNLEGEAEIAAGKILTADLKILSHQAIVKELKLRELTIPECTVDELIGHATMADQILTISNLELKGPDINIQVEGKITIRNPFENSLLDLVIKIKLAPGFLENSDLELFAGLVAKQKDKWFTMPLKGTIKYPKADFKSFLDPSKIPAFKTRKYKNAEFQERDTALERSPQDDLPTQPKHKFVIKTPKLKKFTVPKLYSKDSKLHRMDSRPVKKVATPRVTAEAELTEEEN